MWDHQRDSPGGEEAWHSRSSGDWALAAEGNGMCPTFLARLAPAQPRRPNYVSGLRLCRCVEEKGDAEGPTAARELGISPAPGRRCLLQRPRRLCAEPGVRPGS